MCNMYTRTKSIAFGLLYAYLYTYIHAHTPPGWDNDGYLGRSYYRRHLSPVAATTACTQLLDDVCGGRWLWNKQLCPLAPYKCPLSPFVHI